MQVTIIKKGLARLAKPLSHTSDQEGVTLQEVLLGIAVAAVLAAASIIAGVTFIGRGQAASGRTTLQNAALASEAVYAKILPGGVRNWVGTTDLPATTLNDADEILIMSSLAAGELNQLDEPFEFVPWITKAVTAGSCVPSSAGANQGDCEDPTKGRTPAAGVWFSSGHTAAWTDATVAANIDEGEVWVHVDVEVAHISPRGQTLRMGLKGSDGSTMCVISVKRSIGDGETGRGWQAVDESTSATDAADCGIDASPLANKQAETPGKARTNASLGEPRSSAY